MYLVPSFFYFIKHRCVIIQIHEVFFFTIDSLLKKLIRLNEKPKVVYRRLFFFSNGKRNVTQTVQ